MKALIEGIETYCSILDSGYQLDLFETIYVPSISINLISVSRLDVCGFNGKFGSNSFSFFKISGFIGFDFLIDGLYKLKLDNIFVESLLMYVILYIYLSWVLMSFRSVFDRIWVVIKPK